MRLPFLHGCGRAYKCVSVIVHVYYVCLHLVMHVVPTHEQ
jgi:hypothetical protein